jgi:gluconolactonase
MFFKLGFIISAASFAVLPVFAVAQEGIEGIGPTGEIRQVQGEFQFTEGPAWDGQGHLYFTDIPANRIYRRESDGKIAVFLEPSHHANGLMLNAGGRLFACQMDGQVVSIDPGTKESRTLAGEFMGKRFNAPNDLVIDQAGGVYFTDPAFRAPQPLPQGVTAVYYVDADGRVTRLIDDLPNPNGVILSPDEKTLYVIPSGQKEMMAYSIQSPGKIGSGRVFATLKQRTPDGNGGGDGLTIDTEGNVYITSALGLQVFDPQGKLLGIIEFPEQPANVTFGGPDLRTLYVTARTSLYAAEMHAQGHRFRGQP